MIEVVNIKFDDNGLIPAVLQDIDTKEVLMVAYMNKEALAKTIETKKAWFYSRKRNSLWQKGETSGNYQDVKEIYYDCDCDTLLIEVEPKGPACHTGNKSCFYRKLLSYSQNDSTKEPENTYEKELEGKDVIKELVEVIKSRFAEKPEDSYVAKLYKGGKERILKKVGEEASEVIIASMSGKKDDTIYESADLIFHLLIALEYDGITLDEIMAELKRRRK